MFFFKRRRKIYVAQDDDNPSMGPPSMPPPKESTRLGWFSRLYGKSFSDSWTTTTTGSSRSLLPSKDIRKTSGLSNPYVEGAKEASAPPTPPPKLSKLKQTKRSTFWLLKLSRRGPPVAPPKIPRSKAGPPPAPPKVVNKDTSTEQGAAKEPGMSKLRAFELDKFWQRTEDIKEEKEPETKVKEMASDISETQAPKKRHNIARNRDSVPSLESADL